MKSRTFFHSTSSSSSSPPSSSSSSSSTTSTSYSRYLRPGALAQMRDSKLTNMRRSQICFSLLLLSNSHIQTTTLDSNPSMAMMEVAPPFFPLSPHRTRCLRRKHLSAVAPIFTPSQS